MPREKLMDSELRAETGKQELMQGKITVWAWDMEIKVMLIFQPLIWEICLFLRNEHPMNSKCLEMKVRAVPTLVKTKCEILQIV